MYISYVKVSLPAKLVLPMKSLHVALLGTKHCSQGTSPHFGHILLPYFLISLFKGVFPFFIRNKTRKGNEPKLLPKAQTTSLGVFLNIKRLGEAVFDLRSWRRKQSTHTKGVSRSSCEAVWFGSCQDREGLFWALPSTQSVILGKGLHFSLSLIPSALLWVHGGISRCRNLLPPLTWGRRSSHLRTMKHSPPGKIPCSLTY